MPNDLRISVIIVFHNAARYIGKCAGSLMGQTMKDEIEFIFIDDGSTDNSTDILQDLFAAYPERKHQVRILHNSTNKGTAYSREKGISEAGGEFITFCDVDDWVEPQMYSGMLAAATGADIVCCGYVLEKPKKPTAVMFSSLKFPELDNTPLDTLHFALWNKIIRRGVVTENDLHFFPGIDRWEDLGMLARIFACTRKIKILDKTYYHYRRVAGKSITTSKMERVLDDHLKMAAALSEWFSGKFGNRYSLFVNFVKFSAKIKLMRGVTCDAVRWKRTFPESDCHITEYKNIPTIYRLAFLLASRMPACLLKVAGHFVRLLKL